MNDCLADEPEKRPSAKELVSKLKQYRKDIKNKKKTLYKEVKAVENLPARLNYKIHENASYKSSRVNKGLNSVSRPNDSVEIPIVPLSRPIDIEISIDD
ncbi:hypothetical protein F8M41_001718 [Gigaspora margarita]|uniref:Uncharacterized protein n=1 Tax=Gigaspora margarita TaxID=4874 RepID=A0A8H4AYZ4_GIGMA|nr:hypothetical protein F8M41_001718 [Gigaspora margarita]